jgi:hypothetical protein
MEAEFRIDEFFKKYIVPIRNCVGICKFGKPLKGFLDCHATYALTTHKLF